MPDITDVRGGKPKLTFRQHAALAALAEKHDKFPANTYGFNPWNRGYAALWRRALAPMGLVHLNRLSDFHIRYSITEAGRLALSQGAGE